MKTTLKIEFDNKEAAQHFALGEGIGSYDG
jgi:hypothetical protein